MKLKDICTIIPGFAFKSSDFGTGTNKAIKITDIQPPTVNLHDAFNVSFTPDYKFKVESGDFVMAMTGATIGKIGLVGELTEDTYINQRVCKFNVNEGVSKAYIYYSLLQERFNKFIFANVDSSSAQPNIGHHTVGNFDIALPDLLTQDAIASVLSSLDRKISLNRKANELLESMAKQLYDYWFVQFDFPNEEGKPYKSSGGKMVYNETLKRDIPEGWEVKPLFEAVNVLYGFPFATEYFTEEVTNRPLIRIRDILEGTVSAYTVEDVDDKYLLEKGDVVIGMDGNFHMNYWHNDSTYINQRCVRLRMLPNTPISAMQTLHSLKPYIKAKEANAKGSTVGHLSDKDLKEMFLLLPLVTNSFNPRERFDGLLHKIIANRNETLRLTSLRDYLLPLLMNGQVKVS